MWLSDKWTDYELIDCGRGEKLERWGVKGNHHGPLGQRLPRGQLTGQHGGVAVVRQPLQILPEAADGEGPVVAVCSVSLHKVVVHQDIQLGILNRVGAARLRRNGHVRSASF